MATAEGPRSFEEIFDDQGVPEEFRGPEDYFFHTVTEAESEAHAGETYAIPRQLYVHGDMYGLYDVHDNGAIVNTRASLRGDVTIESRAVVGESLLEGDTSIGWAALVHTGVKLNDSNIGSESEIGPRADIGKANIGDRTKVGESVAIRAGSYRTTIGNDVTIENHASLMGGNKVGSSSIIGFGARLDFDAGLGQDVHVDEGAKIGQGAQVREHARVMPNVSVKARKWIRKGTIVVPKDYRHAKRGW